MVFEVLKSTESINDSMLIDSDTTIAYIELDNNEEATIMVRGDVKVWFNDELYKRPSDFPDELRNVFIDGTADYDERVSISNNNWFEIFYKGFSDTVCAENLSDSNLYEALAEHINYVDKKETIPYKYEDYVLMMKGA